MAKFLLRYRNILLVIFIGGSLLSLGGIYKLRINFSFDKFFPSQDEAVQYFRNYETLFSQNDRVIYIALRNPNGSIFEKEFLQKEAGIREVILSIDNIDSVFSAGNIPEVRRTPLGFSIKSALRFETPEQIRRSKKFFQEDAFLRTMFISKNEEWMSVFILLNPKILDSPLRDEVYDKLRITLDAWGMEYKISGIPAIRTEYVRKVTKELALFISISLILIVLFLFAVFRTWWGVVLPLLGVLFPVIWLMGLMGWLGLELDLLTTLLPPLLFIVGTSDIIHLLSKFLQEIHSGKNKIKAMLITVQEVGWLTFLTSFSTAVSLGSLYFSALKPVQDFGIYSSIGVIIAFIITYLILPGLILLLPIQSYQKVRKEGWLKISHAHQFEKLWQFMNRHQNKIFRVTLAISILGLIGTLKVDENIRLLDDLGANDEIRQNMTFFEEQFMGVRYLEVAIQPKKGVELTDLKFLREVEKLERFLEASGQCKALISLPDVYRRANKILHFQQNRYNKLPANQEATDEISQIAQGNSVWKNVCNDSAGITRISAKMQDLGSYQMAALEKNTRNFSQTNTDTSLYSWRFTGTAILFEKNNEYLTAGLFSGLILSALIILLSMGTLFFSFRMLLIALIPNLIPIIVLGGVMGFSGISLKASTVIVISLCFGIAFDDTIHFLGRLKLEMKKGYTSVDELLQRTLSACGEGLVLTTLVLSAGFLILVVSDFGGTFYIGLFSCVTLLVALAADLFVLPILVKRFFPKSWLPRPAEAKEKDARLP